MSKFTKIKESTKPINLAGGKAYKISDKKELVTLVLTSFVNSQFYRDEDKGIQKIKELINNIEDKKFIAKLALFTRLEFGMRSVSHVIASEIAKNVKGADWTKLFFNKVSKRPDDMLEILGYYLHNYKKPIPNSLKRGFALALTKFNEYQLAKYKNENRDLKLVDLVNLCHPKTNNNIQKLVEGKLKAFNTAQAEISRIGKQDKDLLKNTWKDLIINRKIGYFELLKKLSIIETDCPDLIPEACKMLLDNKLIKNSLILPFRYTQAFEMVKDRKILESLAKAVDIALSNVPIYKGKTLIILDESGSMQGKPAKIGSLFASILYKVNNADLVTFANNAKYKKVLPLDTTISIAKNLENAMSGGGTNFSSAFEVLDKEYDRIFILSDMQGWLGGCSPKQAFEKYKSKFNAKPKVYSFDLAGYGTLQLPEQDVFCIAGFSDKIFDIIKLLEEDKEALINRISNLDF